MSIKTKPVSLQFSLPVIDTKKIIQDIAKPFKSAIKIVKKTTTKAILTFKSNVSFLSSKISSHRKNARLAYLKENVSPALSPTGFPPAPATQPKQFKPKRLNVLNFVSKGEEADSGTPRMKSRRLKGNFKPLFSKFRKYAFIGLLVLVAIMGGVRILGNTGKEGTEQVEVLGAKATQDVNREFLFPLTDSNGEEVSNLKYVIQAAELRDEIVVKGQRATAIEGRTFLILTLKITNEHSQAIEMSTRDYIRLSINGNEDEWLAPDIHNDPVEIQAISTKNTRVGFPMSDTDSNLVLRVGEINGEKETISLELK